MKTPKNIPEFTIVTLNQNLATSTILFLEEVFYEEQNIPKELIPLNSESQHWWGIKNGEEIIGIVAAWKIGSEWHWGRLAIHKNYRGLGLGKKLTLKSLEEFFKLYSDEIIIEAREITVKMLVQVGGKMTGETTDFYGNPITPMVIYQHDFNPKKEI